MTIGSPLNVIGDTFLASLAKSRHTTSPYDYWLLADVLPVATAATIASLPFAAPAGALFDGRREANNSTRVFFSPETQSQFAVARQMAEAFRHPEVKSQIERETCTDLSMGRLRIEYCLDVDGFWLEPHVDIAAKLFTMLVYLSRDPNLRDAGTDVYDDSPEHKLAARAPYEFNTGMIFIPGKNTWHGFAKRPIHGLRKSIIINYVVPEWRSTGELA
jgi:hypothetical protein